jgi:hypothetical protein
MPGPLSCSIVIPVLDDASALDRCLRSIGRQRVRPDEVIVVDNGSRDDSPGVALRHGVTLLREDSPGIAAAAARGYDAATGDVILRLDADSRPPYDWTARVLHHFAMDGGLDAVTGRGRFAAVPKPLRPLTSWYWRSYFGDVGRLIGATPLFGSNLAMRTDAWRRVRHAAHRHDPEVHDDLDLSIHLVEAGCRLRLDPRLVVSISSRPLLHPIGLLRRARRASHTIELHRGAIVSRRVPARIARGAAAGVVATLAMSALVLVVRRCGVLPSLPPRDVVDRLGPALDEDTARVVTAASHLAYGAAAGAVLAAVAGRRVGTVSGGAYGAALWVVGYEGWVPAIGALPPAHRDRPDRALPMLAAHLVYGAVLGRLLGRGRRRA